MAGGIQENRKKVIIDLTNEAVILYPKRAGIFQKCQHEIKKCEGEF